MFYYWFVFLYNSLNLYVACDGENLKNTLLQGYM